MYSLIESNTVEKPLHLQHPQRVMNEAEDTRKGIGSLSQEVRVDLTPLMIERNGMHIREWERKRGVGGILGRPHFHQEGFTHHEELLMQVVVVPASTPKRKYSNFKRKKG